MDDLLAKVEGAELLFSFMLGDYYKYGRNHDSADLKKIFGPFMRLAFFIETSGDIASISISCTMMVNGVAIDEGTYMGNAGDELPGNNGKFTLRFIKVTNYSVEVALKVVPDH